MKLFSTLLMVVTLCSATAMADEISLLNQESLTAEQNNPTALSTDYSNIGQSVGFGGWESAPRRFKGKVISCFAKNDANKTIRTRGTVNAEKLQRDAVRYCRWISRNSNSCRPTGCRTDIIK